MSLDLRASTVHPSIVDHKDLDIESVPCDLCGADAPEPWFETRDTLLKLPYVFSIVRCQRCGLAYLNPRPTRQAIGRFYQTEYYESFSSARLGTSSGRRFFKAIYNRLTGRLAGTVETLPPGRVLDVGCGDGRYLCVFRERGWETVGVEPSAVAVERAKALGLQVFHGGLLEAGLPADTFDLAIMRYTIENMHNPSEVLAETRRVLRPGGKLFLAAPMIDCLIARALKHHTSYVDAPRHLYLFTLETLTRMLSKHGFRVVECRRVPTSGIMVGVAYRLAAAPLRRLLAQQWISRSLWAAELPLTLVLAYAGINRGNVELIAEKVTPSRRLMDLGAPPQRGGRVRFHRLAWSGYRSARGAFEAIGLNRFRLGGKSITERCGPAMRRILWRVFGPHRGTSVEIDGHIMELAGEDPPVPDMVLGRYDEYLRRWLIEFLRPGMNVLDVGAHVGYFSLIAARQVGPTGKIWAFEPVPENYRLLHKNISRNGYTNVMAVPQGISNRKGPLSLYLSGIVSGAHSVVRDQGSRAQVIVQATTLDEFLANAGWPHVDLVKMDIQGAEMMALQGASQFLARNRPLKLIVEFWPAGLAASGTDPKEFLARLVDLGFTVSWAPKKTGRLKPVESDEVIDVADREGVDLLCDL
jgi:FkbM family methyltransferase